MGCTVLEHHERVKLPARIQINGDETINLVPTSAPWQIYVKDHRVMKDVLICDL